jgi:hypothetical protein
MFDPKFGIATVAAGTYIAWSFEEVKEGEMAEVMFYKRHWYTLGPGWWPILKPLSHAVIFPTSLIPLTLRIPLVTAEGATAGTNPLDHRLSVTAEVTLFYRFIRSKMYHVLINVTLPNLGELLGRAMKNAAEQVLARNTYGTIIEKKAELGEQFGQRLGLIISKEESLSWGIAVTHHLIGPIELHPTVDAGLARSVALALEGQAYAERIGYMTSYIETEEGKLAADHDTARIVASAAKTVVMGTGKVSPPFLVTA